MVHQVSFAFWPSCLQQSNPPQTKAVTLYAAVLSCLHWCMPGARQHEEHILHNMGPFAQ